MADGCRNLSDTLLHLWFLFHRMSHKTGAQFCATCIKGRMALYQLTAVAAFNLPLKSVRNAVRPSLIQGSNCPMGETIFQERKCRRLYRLCGETLLKAQRRKPLSTGWMGRLFINRRCPCPLGIAVQQLSIVQLYRSGQNAFQWRRGRRHGAHEFMPQRLINSLLQELH